MTEVYFYHLERQPLERVLPRILERSLERGWRCVVRAGSPERVEAISTLLWTYSEESFLPHGSKADGAAASQPVWLTDGAEMPNQPQALFLVDGAEAGEISGLQRAVFLFEGADEDALQRARAAWKAARAAGHQVSYWQQDDNGRWVDKAR